MWSVVIEIYQQRARLQLCKIILRIIDIFTFFVLHVLHLVFTSVFISMQWMASSEFRCLSLPRLLRNYLEISWKLGLLHSVVHVLPLTTTLPSPTISFVRSLVPVHHSFIHLYSFQEHSRILVGRGVGVGCWGVDSCHFHVSVSQSVGIGSTTYK